MVKRSPLMALVAVGVSAACGGGATTTVGLITQTAPALCISKDAAKGVCLPGGIANGRSVGDCVTFTYTGAAGSPKSLRVIGLAKIADHLGDCPIRR